MKILVVGGGTAGFISALILKKFLNATVDMVYSKKIGVAGVGEGATEHWQDFMNFIGIDQFTIIKECDATFKGGIKFENWSEKPYLHSVADPYSNKIAQYPHIYANLIINNSNYLNSKMLWENKIDSWFLNKNERPPFNQYHFNTFKLNDFLTKLANSFNIKMFDDEIKDVVFKENGEINFLIGEKNQYNYDFYIDASGFGKILIGKMGAEWVSFSKYLKMKSAIVFPSADEDEYNLWSYAKAMDYGWIFKTPVWGRHGNGYIFDSDYINADRAKEELDKEFGYDVEIKKTFNFDPGYLKNSWIKNCAAVGLSAGFVEPLEASSIGSTIQQSYLLMHKITNYSKKEIDNYNKSFVSIMENIRDYLVLHYITKKNNTQFWIDVSNIKLPESLENNLQIWKNKMPIREDFKNQSPHCLFWEDNFIFIMHGLKLFNIDSIKKEYYSLSPTIQYFAEDTLKNQKINELNKIGISHKKYIQIVRELL
jgi:tryptophan halogenase